MAAAVGNSGHLLSMFASWFRSRKISWRPFHVRERLHAAMETAIQVDHPKVLRSLVRFHDEHAVCEGEESQCALRPRNYHFDREASCLDRYVCLAARHGSINAFRLLLRIQGLQLFDPLVFEKACKYGQLDFIRSTLHKNIWHMSDGLARDGGLSECARYTGRDIAELLIDSGAVVHTSDAWQMAVRNGDVTMLRFLAGRGTQVKAYDSGNIRLHPNGKEVSGLWNDQLREDRLLAHYVAFKISKTDDESGDTATLKQLLSMVEGSPRWRSKVSAAISTKDAVLKPEARLYDQFLINFEF